MSPFQGFRVCAGVVIVMLLVGCRSAQRATVSVALPRVDAPIATQPEQDISIVDEGKSSLQTV